MLILELNFVRPGLNSVCFQDASADCVHSFIYDKCRLEKGSYFLKKDGRIVGDECLKGYVQVVPKLLGGKGGFGSMLRAIGAQIEKTTNREACRDLSGRRLRDINEEQRLKKWILQQSERENDVEKKRQKKIEKLSRQPKHEFKDEAYDAERADLTEKLSDAVDQGFKASVSGCKRKAEDKPPQKRKKKFMLNTMDDEFSSSEDESSNEQSSSSEGKEETQIEKQC